MVDIRVGKETKVAGLTQSIAKELRKGERFSVSAIGLMAVHHMMMALGSVHALDAGPFTFAASAELAEAKIEENMDAARVIRCYVSPVEMED